jgi:putative transposase
MERYWRTLREGALDFLGRLTSLHAVNVRLWAFLDQHYHHAPHAGLYGKSPEAVFRTAPPSPVIDEDLVHEALTIITTGEPRDHFHRNHRGTKDQGSPVQLAL